MAMGLHIRRLSFQRRSKDGCGSNASEVVAEQRHILGEQRQEQQLREHQEHLEQQRQQKLQDSASRQRQMEKNRHEEERDAEAALLQIEQALAIRHGEPFTIRKSEWEACHVKPPGTLERCPDSTEVLLVIVPTQCM